MSGRSCRSFLGLSLSSESIVGCHKHKPKPLTYAHSLTNISLLPAPSVWALALMGMKRHQGRVYTPHTHTHPPLYLFFFTFLSAVCLPSMVLLHFPFHFEGRAEIFMRTLVKIPWLLLAGGRPPPSLPGSQASLSCSLRNGMEPLSPGLRLSLSLSLSTWPRADSLPCNPSAGKPRACQPRGNELAPSTARSGGTGLLGGFIQCAGCARGCVVVGVAAC